MPDVWTEEDERILQAMQQRKKATFEAARDELLRDLEAVVPKHSGSTYSGHYSPREVADALIKHGGMFRDALAPFDHMGRPIQNELPIEPEWIEHDGGPCPAVGEDTEVEYETRMGSRDVAPAGEIRWPHGKNWPKGGDLIRYRVLSKPAQDKALDDNRALSA